MMNAGGKAPSGGSPTGSGGGMSKMKLGIIILVPIAVCLIAVSQFILPSYVLKADFTKNILGVTDTVDKAGVAATQAINSMKATVDAVPSSVITQVNAAVSKATADMDAKIATVQTQVSNMAGAVATSTNKLTSVDALTSRVTAIETAATALSARLDTQVQLVTNNLTTQNAVQSQQIADLAAQVALLQQGLSLSISGSNATWAALPTGSWNAVPVLISNSGTLGINVPIKLVINYPPADTNVTALGNLSGMVVSYSTGQIVFNTTLMAIPPSISYPISVQLSYSGDVTSGWSYAWSKQ